MIKHWWLIWRLALTFALLSVPLILYEYLGTPPQPRQVMDYSDEILDRLDTIEDLLITQQELLVSHLRHHQENVSLDNKTQNRQIQLHNPSHDALPVKPIHPSKITQPPLHTATTPAATLNNNRQVP